MYEVSERCAIAVREWMDLGDEDLPTFEHVDEFAHEIPDLIVEVDPAEDVPQYSRLDDGRGLITLPHPCRPERYAHEISHHLRRDGLASLLRAIARGDSRLERLAELCGWLEEGSAEAFVLALFLPATLVLRYTDNELAELTGWSLQVIRKRRGILADQVFQKQHALWMDVMMGRGPLYPQAEAEG